MSEPNPNPMTEACINFQEEAQSTNPIAPRAHKKSKRGCRVCKERKIKCDENHPVCNNCHIYFQGQQKRCEYGAAQPVQPTTRPLRRRSTIAMKAKETEAPRRHSASSIIVPPRVPTPIRAQMIDPFQTHPPTGEHDSDALMKHYFSTCVFNMFPFYPAPGKNPQTKYYAPLIYTDPVLFHVTLQLSAIHLEKMQAKPDTQRSRRLMGECLRLLRERVEEASSLGVSDETISAVAGLAAIEHEKGNMRMVQMHVAGLKRMLGLRGGLNGIRRTNKMVANIVFCMFIAAVDEPFPQNDLIEGTEKPDWYWAALPTFQSPYYVDFASYGVDLEYAAIMNDIRLLASTYQTAADCCDAEHYLSVLTFLCATLQRMLSLPPLADPASAEYYITEACRSALAMHVFSQWCGHQPDPSLMVSNARHNLKSALRPLMVPGAGNPLLLWLLAAGAVGAFGTPERTWFVGHLVAVVEEMGVRSWEQFGDVLKRVIWHGHQDEPTHESLWREVAIRIDVE